MSIENTLGEIQSGVAELRTKYESGDAVNAGAIEALETKMTTQLDEIRQTMASANEPRMDAQDQLEAAKEAFANLTFKAEGWSPKNELHVKAASESNFAVNQNGGFTLPKVFLSETTEILRKNSPLRSMATVISGGLGYVSLFKTAHGTASERAETAAVSAGEASQYGELSFGSSELYMNVPVSVWTLDGDSAVDFASMARNDVLAGIADLEASNLLDSELKNTIRHGASTTTLINAGLNKMAVTAAANRFTNVPGTIGGVETTAADAVSFDDLINLQQATAEKYRSNGSYLIGAELEGKLFKMKDADGNYIWAIDNHAGGAPASIRGKAYMVSDYMPDVTGAADGARLALFGDFKKFVIIEQAGISWVVDPITNLRQVKYHARMREGFGLVDYQALRVLTNKAA